MEGGLFLPSMTNGTGAFLGRAILIFIHRGVKMVPFNKNKWLISAVRDPLAE